MSDFSQLGLEPRILQAVHDVGYEVPSPIQEQAIPPLLQGKDVIGQAQTGSGKTAAFGLPMLQFVDPSEPEVQALVLTPTRELCIQVTQALRAYGIRKGVDVVAVFGGAPIRSQQSQLRAGGHIVVGTVGRVKDLISRHALMLHSCRFVVLDEADEMLDLGFLEDVERILSLTPSSRQTALFSATMPPPIRRLAERYLYDPVTIKVKTDTLTVDTVEQFALSTPPREKIDRLSEVLESERPTQAIVFVRTKIRCDELHRRLRDRGLDVRALHGDMTQGARDGVMISFKDGRAAPAGGHRCGLAGARHHGRLPRDQLRCPHLPGRVCPPHRQDRTGGPKRPSDHALRASPEADIEAIEKHAGVKLAPWVAGAHVAPTPVVAKPRRHSKPRLSVDGNGPARKLIVAAGRSSGLEPSDIIHAITAATGLDGEAVRNVRVLERFSFLEVPSAEADRVVELVSETEVRGQKLRLEPASG